MTSNKAVSLLSQMFLPCFNDEEKEALTMAINAIQDNSRQKAEDSVDMLHDHIASFFPRHNNR